MDLYIVDASGFRGQDLHDKFMGVRFYHSTQQKIYTIFGVYWNCDTDQWTAAHNAPGEGTLVRTFADLVNNPNITILFLKDDSRFIVDRVSISS